MARRSQSVLWAVPSRTWTHHEPRGVLQGVQSPSLQKLSRVQPQGNRLDMHRMSQEYVSTKYTCPCFIMQMTSYKRDMMEVVVLLTLSTRGRLCLGF